ncbi:hypothetical protein [Amycolatopsis sp. DSM 110486]|uniref:hypothetical protein n=1 Tax=Amycolatopsis sp. DSM 110486 TaxID=2865832 RepID=UPI001C6A5C60|nr:hypothetical protein [Amycolatopsis sp. DSM 110486]QYN17585.1 hypothetical protein K1T34_32895 [Amycolatopsis sp. DSM 110486]
MSVIKSIGKAVKTTQKAIDATDRMIERATPKAKVVAAATPPVGQCIGCGTHRKLTTYPYGGKFSYCNKPACVAKAAARM